MVLVLILGYKFIGSFDNENRLKIVMVKKYNEVIIGFLIVFLYKFMFVKLKIKN